MNPVAEVGNTQSPRDLLKVIQSRCLFPVGQNAVSEIHLWVNKVETDTYQSAQGEAINTQEHTYSLERPASATMSYLVCPPSYYSLSFAAIFSRIKDSGLLWRDTVLTGSY